MADRPLVGVLPFEGEDSPPGLEEIADLADVRVVTGETGLEPVLAASDVLLVLDFRADVLRRAWPAACRLRWVHAASAGVDNLMFPELRDSDVVVTNARGVFDAGVAEWVLSVMLAFCKDLPATLQLQRERTWRHRETQGAAGKHVVVVGAGGIGRAVVRLARAVGMTATAVARRARVDDELGTVLAVADLERALPDADFLVLAAPLTPETRRLVDGERLALLQPGARIVNVGRGELLDEPALVDALRAGRLAGAALDVFWEEPLPVDHPLWTLPGVIVSPHMSGDAVGWRRALTDQFVDNLRRLLAGEPLRNVVDKHAGYVRGDHTATEAGEETSDA